MNVAAEKQMEHIGETRGVADCTHDLIQVFSIRINSLWRYDQYIANAEDHPELQEFWREMKRHDMEVCEKLKRLLAVRLKEEETTKTKR